ncbi:MAG: FMN-dependent NADH-azoreductase [Microbacteriaceae bacterium]
MRILNIVSSPRPNGASVTVANAFLETLAAEHPDLIIDTLDVWKEDLPEYDAAAIGAKYKGVSGEEMDETEQRVWNRIQQLAERFRCADRIVLGVPMWNWSHPYKLKQLIDLVSQRGMLFTFDGTHFGPALDIPRALVIFSRGQYYAEDGPTPASHWDHQSAFITFFLTTIGVRDVRTLLVEHTWDDQVDASIAAACKKAAAQAADF